jgi:hypothetical protein
VEEKELVLEKVKILYVVSGGNDISVLTRIEK